MSKFVYEMLLSLEISLDMASEYSPTTFRKSNDVQKIRFQSPLGISNFEVSDQATTVNSAITSAFLSISNS